MAERSSYLTELTQFIATSDGLLTMMAESNGSDSNYPESGRRAQLSFLLTIIGCVSQIVGSVPAMLPVDETALPDAVRLTALQVYQMGQKGLDLEEFVDKTGDACDWCQRLLNMIDPKLGAMFYDVITKWT